MIYKIITITMGIIFIITSVIVVMTAENGIFSYLGAFIIGSLGVDAVYSALKNRRSIIAKIGPLP